jgi:2-polyprenyl-3-methyl-5-hydroxy-6-metoxy-1,4-benzoquinol methylase
MVYAETIDDPHALIFDGPVIYDGISDNVLTSSNLDDVNGSWELKQLFEKETELPCLRRNAQQALAKIERHMKKEGDSRILDFGSGFGFFLAEAKEKGWDAYGIEPLPATAVYARATFGLKIITDTLHENTFPNEYFDVITSFQVFEHIPHPNDSLNFLGKMLKRGGILLIEIPRYDTWSMRLLRARHRHYVQDHLNFYTYRTLRAQMEQNGFKVIDSYRPQRIMSIRHLYTRWLAKDWPKSLFQVGRSILQLSGVWERNLGVDTGDMLAMIGRNK